MHHSGVALEIRAARMHTKGLRNGQPSSLTLLRGIARDQLETDLSQQPHRPLFRPVLHTNRLSLSVGENEFHGLVGLCDSRLAIERDSAGLHMNFFGSRSTIFMGPFGDLGAFQFELN